jgi:hypothetical protein
MVLTAHQPAYLPWLGYFDKIIRSEIFVFLDTVQYEKNSFINRNQIMTKQGPIWLTVPVKIKGHIGSTILDTRIDNSQNWAEKHLKSIFLNYKKAPGFAERFPRLESLYQSEYDFLADLCFGQLVFWLKELGIEKNIVRLGQLPVKSRKTDLVFDLCSYFGADHYLSGILGKNYLQDGAFKEAGIAIEYQDYKYPAYAQVHGDFVPNLSIVDFYLNGADCTLITRRE